jgi:hypothetical protein
MHRIKRPYRDRVERATDAHVDEMQVNAVPTRKYADRGATSGHRCKHRGRQLGAVRAHAMSRHTVVTSKQSKRGRHIAGARTRHWELPRTRRDPSGEVFKLAEATFRFEQVCLMRRCRAPSGLTRWLTRVRAGGHERLDRPQRHWRGGVRRPPLEKNAQGAARQPSCLFK